MQSAPQIHDEEAQMRPWLMTRASLVMCASLVLCTPLSAFAQRPAGADSLSRRAVADSLTVLRGLARDLRQDSRNAELWYRQGMIAWALHDRDRAAPSGDIDWTTLGRMADTSLRIAQSLDPSNVKYTLTLGQYFLGTGLMSLRVQSYDHFHDALAMARRGADDSLRAVAAIEYGRLFWRRYDAAANGISESAEPGEVRIRAEELARTNASAGSGNRRLTRDATYTQTDAANARAELERARVGNAGEFTGESDYILAETFFREAYGARPMLGRTYQQLAMLLAERARWSELAAFAHARTQSRPTDGWAWLTLGLAAQRGGDLAAARGAFASALELLPPGERNRLDHIERVRAPRDSFPRGMLSDSARGEVARRFWLEMDPMWSLPDVDPRSEFLARVTYAELRWTVDELTHRGADSDRGVVYVRYGHPDRIVTEGDITTWSYDVPRLTFRFRGAPTFGTAAYAEARGAGNTLDSVPSLWDKLATMRIDTLAAVGARFRGASDSVDVLLASRTPVETIRRAAEVAGPVRTDAWLLTDRLQRVRHDSLLNTPAGVRTAIVRLGAGNYLYRVEATADASPVAARGAVAFGVWADSLAGFPTRGFGLSDLLLVEGTSTAEPNASRWSDLTLTPLVGSTPRGTAISLVWENYDFGSRGADAEYLVEITLRRNIPNTTSIGAQIIGALSASFGRSVAPDQVQFTVERQRQHRDALVEQVALDLRDTPAGTYDVRLRVTDRVTGRTAERSARLDVRD